MSYHMALNSRNLAVRTHRHLASQPNSSQTHTQTTRHRRQTTHNLRHHTRSLRLIQNQATTRQRVRVIRTYNPNNHLSTYTKQLTKILTVKPVISRRRRPLNNNTHRINQVSLQTSKRKFNSRARITRTNQISNAHNTVSPPKRLHRRTTPER